MHIINFKYFTVISRLVENFILYHLVFKISIRKPFLLRIGEIYIIDQSEANIGKREPYQGLSPDSTNLWGTINLLPRSNPLLNSPIKRYSRFNNRSFNERFYLWAFHFISYLRELKQKVIKSKRPFMMIFIQCLAKTFKS